MFNFKLQIWKMKRAIERGTYRVLFLEPGAERRTAHTDACRFGSVSLRLLIA
jgi:hypothetical protein